VEEVELSTGEEVDEEGTEVVEEKDVDAGRMEVVAGAIWAEVDVGTEELEEEVGRIVELLDERRLIEDTLLLETLGEVGEVGEEGIEEEEETVVESLVMVYTGEVEELGMSEGLKTAEEEEELERE
jgi:hypothetical protein